MTTTMMIRRSCLASRLTSRFSGAKQRGNDWRNVMVARNSRSVSNLLLSLDSQQVMAPSFSKIPILASSSSSSFLNKTSSLQYFSTAASQDDEETTTTPPSPSLSKRHGVRNVAIVAHVDHGKTTLVDELLRYSEGTGGDRLMDCGDLEKERGITITSKVTRIDLPDGKIINVVDTPGHADFAGEVDRILGMVDGVCLIVDASEGPMAQTKYVLSRALKLGKQPICVLNKADRSDAKTRLESGETESELLDLFDALDATDEQMDYMTLYASGREGWTVPTVEEVLEGDPSKDGGSVKSLMDAIWDCIPEPTVHTYDVDVPKSESSSRGLETFESDKFSMAATTVGFDQYLGRTCTGRIYSGSIGVGDAVRLLPRDATSAKMEGREANAMMSNTSGVFVTKGIDRVEFSGGDGARAVAGDIVTVTGVPDSMAVGDTITSKDDPIPHPIMTPPLAPPTLSMDFGPNTGPLAGQEQKGTVLTSSKVRERLMKETDNNVTINVVKSETDADKCTVFGRGELQLGILVEQMRRENFELLISPPRILTKKCPDTGKTLEPFEEVTVDVDKEFSGEVINGLTGTRKGILMEMTDNPADGKTRMVFEVPSRSLLGFASEIATATRGTAVVNHTFLEDREHAGLMFDEEEKGKLISTEKGKVTAYALSPLVEKGTLFVEPGDAVYRGMVIGERNRPGDMDVNPIRAKEVTNMRAAGKDDKISLPPPKKRTVEEYIGYMNDDEMIEVTPTSIRLRKEELDPQTRLKIYRSLKKQRKALLANKSGGGGGGGGKK